jgi:hypothetical protein
MNNKYLIYTILGFFVIAGAGGTAVVVNNNQKSNKSETSISSVSKRVISSSSTSKISSSESKSVSSSVSSSSLVTVSSSLTTSSVSNLEKNYTTNNVNKASDLRDKFVDGKIMTYSRFDGKIEECTNINIIRDGGVPKNYDPTRYDCDVYTINDQSPSLDKALRDSDKYQDYNSKFKFTGKAKLEKKLNDNYGSYVFDKNVIVELVDTSSNNLAPKVYLDNVIMFENSLQFSECRNDKVFIATELPTGYDNTQYECDIYLLFGPSEIIYKAKKYDENNPNKNYKNIKFRVSGFATLGKKINSKYSSYSFVEDPKIEVAK